MADIYSKGKKSVDGIDGGLRFEQDNNRIIGRDENNIPSLIIDSDPINGFEMKISKLGIDVTSATNDQLIFNSSQNVLKVVSTGTVTLPTYNVTSGAGWASSSVAIPPNAVVTHNLGGIPMAFVFMKVTGPGGPTLLALPNTNSGLIGSAYYSTRTDFAINGTNLEIGQYTITNGNVGTLVQGGQTIEYWIMQESAT